MALHKEYKDYYRVLGVTRSADAHAIKQAYRRLARKYHPDVSQEPNAEELFKALNEAYETLSSPTKRQRYDAQQPKSSHSSYYEGAKTSRTHYKYSRPTPPKRERPNTDFFEDISRTEPKTPKTSGFSSFLESLFGKSKPADAAKPQLSSTDNILELQIEETFQDTVKTVKTPAGRSIQIRVPKGATDGKKLRLPGHGLNGQDWVITLRLIPHPHYQFQGRDIHRELPIAPWEAAIGASIAVPTPQGLIKLKVAPGSQSGLKLRLSGKGLATEEGTGDMYVTLQIYTPPAHTSAQRELYQQMESLFPWKPR